MPTHPLPAIDAFLVEIRRGIGTGFSAVLYGSAARGDYREGSSDVNLLVILDAIDVDILARLRPALLVWRDVHEAAPLLMTRAEWRRAVDVFPIEVTDIQHAYEVLQGPDPVEGLAVEPHLLRLALEGELRGKLLRLRQAYAAEADNPAALGGIAIESLPMVLVLFRALLTLARRPVPRTPGALIGEAARLVGFAPEPVRDIIAHRADQAWQWSPAEFAGYLEVIERSAHFVDTYDSGVQQ
jgi:predicted nucleotidyltransferase